MSDIATKRDSAHIYISGKGENAIVRVAASSRVNGDQLTRINEVLVNDVIKGLTGCACLSGVIDVIFDHGFEKAIHVQF